MRIQPKLAVNTPGDIYEQEADHLSEQVMRMPEPQLQRACACGGGCPRCDARPSQPGAMHVSGLSQEHPHLQPEQVRPSDSGQIAAPSIVNEVLASPGQPLDPATRAFMEPRFGHDFSCVRVHTDGAAQASAEAEGSLAYAVGRHVVFGVGQYRPHTLASRWVIAHELAHVIQQEGSAPESGAVAGALEREAGEAGMRVALGGTARASAAQGGPAVQFLKVSSGGFGKVLEDFTNTWSVADQAIQLLKKSPTFMKLAATLDKHYIWPFDPLFPRFSDIGVSSKEIDRKLF